MIGLIPVIWLALLLAPRLQGGLPEVFRNFGSIMQDPLHIELCGDSLKTVLAFLLIYAVAAAVIRATAIVSHVFFFISQR